MRIRIVVAVITTACLSLSSLAFFGNTHVLGQERPLATLRYASWGPKLVDQADYFVAEELGYFKDEGLKVDWISAQGGGDALRHVLGGNADLAATDPVLILFTLDKGVKVRAFYAITPVNQFTVIARRSKGIESVRDLRGKRIAVTSMASGSRYNVMTILNANGLKESDATLVATGLNFGGPIEQGQVDAAGTWAVINWDLVNRVLPKSIAQDLVVFKAADYLNAPTNVFATTEELLSSKRDLLVRFIRAHRRGTAFMHANPERAAEIAAKHAVGAKDDKERNLAIVKLRMWMQLDEGARRHGFGWISEDVLNDFARRYHEWGLVKNTYAFKDFATNDLVQTLGK